MIGKEQLVEFLEGVVMRDELGEIVTAEQVEEISKKLFARIDVQQGQLDGLQSMIGVMQVKITQLQLQLAKMEEKLADKETEVVAAREKTEAMARQLEEQKAQMARMEEQKSVMARQMEDDKAAMARRMEEQRREAAKREAAEMMEAEARERNAVYEGVRTTETGAAWRTEGEKTVPVGDVKEHGGNQTIADSIKGEESLGDKLSKSVDHETVASNINSSKIERIQTAITIADRFRFQRELFAGDAVKMAETVEMLNNMKNLDEALAYITKNFKWDMEVQVTKDFIRIVERRYL